MTRETLVRMKNRKDIQVNRRSQRLRNKDKSIGGVVDVFRPWKKYEGVAQKRRPISDKQEGNEASAKQRKIRDVRNGQELKAGNYPIKFCKGDAETPAKRSPRLQQNQTRRMASVILQKTRTVNRQSTSGPERNKTGQSQKSVIKSRIPPVKHLKDNNGKKNVEKYHEVTGRVLLSRISKSKWTNPLLKGKKLHGTKSRQIEVASVSKKLANRAPCQQQEDKITLKSHGIRRQSRTRVIKLVLERKKVDLASKTDRKMVYKRRNVSHEREISQITSRTKVTKQKANVQTSDTCKIPKVYLETTVSSLEKFPVMSSKLKCMKCDKRFMSETRYQSHLETHESPSVQQRKQEAKIRQITSTSTVDNSNPTWSKADRELNDNFLCSKCNRKFFNKDTFLNHLRNHESTTGEQHIQASSLENEKLKVDDSSWKPEDLNFELKTTLLSFKPEYLDIKLPPKDNEDKSNFASVDSQLDFSQNIEVKQEDVLPREKSVSSKSEENGETKRGKLRCGVCRKLYGSKKRYFSHMKRHSKPTSRMTFPELLTPVVKIEELGDLMSYLSIDRNETPIDKESSQTSFSDQYPPVANGLKCPKCSKIFTYRSGLLSHIRSHRDFPVNAMRYLCKRCDKVFMFKAGFMAHIRAHTIIRKTYICSICNKNFKNNYHYIRHMRVHTNERPYQCQICFKSFAMNYGLKDHVRRHFSRGHTCRRCDKIFANSDELKEHKETHSGTLNSVIGKTSTTENYCGQCNITFFACRDFFLHQGRVHQNWRYVCATCNKGYVFRNKLKAHENSHLGIKLYVCSICQKRFTRKEHLDRHSKLHTGEKSFVCDQCDYATFRKDYINRHRKIHTKRPFACLMCRNLFSREELLKKHNKRYHRGNSKGGDQNNKNKK